MITEVSGRLKAVDILRQAGIANPVRLVDLIRRTINFLELDLSGLTVLTEAASGPYAVTPVIAALAGAARVLALTQESSYATVQSVIAQTQALETLCQLQDRVEIHSRRSLDLFAEADIVTNLGFVRPIDAAVVRIMKPTAVVPLMCESWEFRPGDVDLAACQAKGIAVLGTNEDYPGLEIFSYSGELCQNLLFEAQIEVHKSKFIVVSSDKFGRVIQRQLTASGACVCLIPTLKWREELSGADALVVADYTRENVIIGPDGDMTAEELACNAPCITVIQFAGVVDVLGMRGCGLAVYPGIKLPPHRMAKTLAALGPRPVIELHAAGLKVGELAVRGSSMPAHVRKRYDALIQSLS
jgi:hypothetical protein